jgi:chlorobactene glucosyltransferase
LFAPHRQDMLTFLSTLALAISGGTLLTNLVTFRTPRGTVPAPAPKVSILVPARNEELNIRACVESLLTQHYPNFEIIVLNDHSEDSTGTILAEIQAKQTPDSPKLTIIEGTTLPAGWAGKNWACHQLAQTADLASRYLLFTDADTVHRPYALRAAVAEAERKNLALLSLMPEQQVETLAEKVIVPLFGLQILGYLPLLAMEHFPVPAFAAANGQYLLFQRDAYFRMEGHAAIAGEIAEDVSLARLAKGQGKIRLANGAGLVSCRMYRNLDEILRGFRRSFSSGFCIDPAISWMMVALNFFAYLLPFLRLVMGDNIQSPSVSRHRNRVSAVETSLSFTSPRYRNTSVPKFFGLHIPNRFTPFLVGTIILLRTLLAWRTRTPFITVIGHPIGIAFLLYSQLRAAQDARVGQSTAWKGRSYTLKKE